MARILVLEDEEISQTIIREALQEHSIMIADTFEMAVEMVGQYDFEMAIVDIVLPSDRDGIDFLSFIRNSDKLKNMKVMLISTKDTVESQCVGYNIGANAYVTKPFDVKILKSMVNGFLKLGEPEPLERVVGPVLFDFDTKRTFFLTMNEQEEISLSAAHQTLLYLLMQNEGIIVSFAILEEKLDAPRKTIINRLNELKDKVQEFGSIAIIKNEGAKISLVKSQLKAS